MKTFKYFLLASMFGAAMLTACNKEGKDDKPATKPVIEITAGEAEGSVVVKVTSDWDLTSVKITQKAGAETKVLADETSFKDPKNYEYSATLEFPAKVYVANVSVDATNVKNLSNTQSKDISIPEPAVDPDAPVLYNFAKEFVSVSRKAWNENHAAGKIKQHTESTGLITDDVHYIPDVTSDPDASGLWTTYTVAGKTYSTAEAYEIATIGFLQLFGYDTEYALANKTGSSDDATWHKLAPAATLSTQIPAPKHDYTWSWGSMPYNESGSTGVGGTPIDANGGPLRYGVPADGTVGGQANCATILLMKNYAKRHYSWSWNHEGVVSNMCGYTDSSRQNEVANKFFGTCCTKRFFLMLVSFYEYMLDNNLMDTSSMKDDLVFNNTALFGNAKWD